MDPKVAMLLSTGLLCTYSYTFFHSLNQHTTPRTGTDPSNMRQTQICPQAYFLEALALSILPFGPDTHQQFQLRDMGPLGIMERGFIEHLPTNSAHSLGSGSMWLS